jgi:hypothetical protein
MTEDCSDLLVNACHVDVTCRVDDRRRPKHQRGLLDRIDAEIEKPAAAQHRIEVSIVRIDRTPHPEVGNQMIGLANLTGVDEGPQGGTTAGDLLHIASIKKHPFRSAESIMRAA